MSGPGDKRELEKRSSDRIRDNSKLLISGRSISGVSFVETARVNDVSSGGISFWSRTRLEPDVVLDVSFWSEKSQEGQFSLVASVKVRVLRVTQKGDLFLVAGPFQDKFICFSNPCKPEDIARELQLAVEIDENARRNEVSPECFDLIPPTL